MRRLFWVAVGAASTVATLRKARSLAEQHVPAGARSALGAAATLAGVARRVTEEFRAGTAEREAELRADLLAGADLPRSRARVDAWRAERAGRATADSPPDDRETAPGTPRPGSAAAARAGATAVGGGARRRRGGASHRAEDPDDGPLGYSFF